MSATSNMLEKIYMSCNKPLKLFRNNFVSRVTAALVATRRRRNPARVGRRQSDAEHVQGRCYWRPPRSTLSTATTSLLLHVDHDAEVSRHRRHWRLCLLGHQQSGVGQASSIPARNYTRWVSAPVCYTVLLSTSGVALRLS